MGERTDVKVTYGAKGQGYLSMKLEQLIPVPVQRRLILGLIGFRREDREWILGLERLHEETLDALDDEQWQCYVTRWLASAVSAN